MPFVEFLTPHLQMHKQYDKPLPYITKMENTQAQLAQAAYHLPLPRLYQPSEPPENSNCVACITIDCYYWKATSIAAIHVPEP